MIGVAQVVDDDEVMLITDGGKVLRCRVSGISTMGRATQGVRADGPRRGREARRGRAARRARRGRRHRGAARRADEADQETADELEVDAEDAPAAELEVDDGDAGDEPTEE